MNETLKEAGKLWKLGFAIHWLHAKSKRPVESGWTTGPRKEWNELVQSYRPGYNLGVRLGTPSRLKDGFLAVVDIDVKSKDKTHRLEALKCAERFLDGKTGPKALSGRGGGSSHIYFLTRDPFKPITLAKSSEVIKVKIPSKAPSKKELKELTDAEIKSGLRLSPAWEVAVYSDGRQMVLPPSTHPDTGRPYVWGKDASLKELRVVALTNNTITPSKEERELGASEQPKETDFKFTPVSIDIALLPLPEKMLSAIVDGTGVEDRSEYLFLVASRMVKAGLGANEILSALTDKTTYLGKCAYEHAKSNDRTRAARWLYRYTVKRVLEENTSWAIFESEATTEPLPKLTVEEQKKVQARFDKQKDWRDDLARSGNRGEGPPKGTVQNIVLILTNHIGPAVVRMDEFAIRDHYGCNVPWGKTTGDAVTDDDIACMRHWFGVQYGVEPKREAIWDAITKIARQNSYDPVRDWLDALPEWDGIPRLDDWLAMNFEAEGDPEYLAQVFRKWMVAMVGRIYHPGMKFDWMPIFEGAQGAGKSSFGRLLVGDKHFTDWLPNLGDKDAALGLQGMWGVEMGELSQFRKNEMEEVKGFITRTIDKVRPPYGRKVIESARRCVFFGTTNKDAYLRDETGNRRFKPIKVGELDFDVLREEREQLFAEAKHLWDSLEESEETLYLTDRAKDYEREIQADKMVEDDGNVMFYQLKEWLEKDENPDQNIDRKKFKISELFLGAGPLANWKADNRNYQFASKALRLCGGIKKKVMGFYFWDLGN